MEKRTMVRGAVALALVFMAGAVASAEQLAVNGVWMTPEEAATIVVPDAIYDLEPGAGESGPQWGGSANSIWATGACGAGSRDATHTYQAANCVRVEPIPAGTTTAVGWKVNLPTGALITAVRMHYFDNIAGEPSVGFYQVTNTGGLNNVVGLTPGAFTGGNATFTATLATPHQVTNAGAGYQVLAILNRTGASTTHGIYGFEVLYRLQVSPAPATATFTDVPTSHPFFRFVEALVAAGITGGCGGGNYCPDNAVTRGQMAVFLSVALGMHFPN